MTHCTNKYILIKYFMKPISSIFFKVSRVEKPTAKRVVKISLRYNEQQKSLNNSGGWPGSDGRNEMRR